MEQSEPENEPIIKEMEARIIVFLGIADEKHRYLSYIVNKLDIDYSYTQRTLTDMTRKKWIRREPIKNKIHYSLTNINVHNKSKDILIKMKQQMLDKLEKSYNQEE